VTIHRQLAARVTDRGNRAPETASALKMVLPAATSLRATDRYELGIDDARDALSQRMSAFTALGAAGRRVSLDAHAIPGSIGGGVFGILGPCTPA
jgi:hypothetical protein